MKKIDSKPSVDEIITAYITSSPVEKEIMQRLTRVCEVRDGRFFVKDSDYDHVHNKGLENALSEISEAVFKEQYFSYNSGNAPLFRDDEYNKGIYIPFNFITLLNESQSLDLNNALKKFESQKNIAADGLAAFNQFCTLPGAWVEFSDTRAEDNLVMVELDDGGTRRVDPIHDFSKYLNKRFGEDMFSQATVYDYAGDGHTRLAISPLDALSLDALPERDRQELACAFLHPRQFVQDQRREAGFAGSLQAKFDQKLGSWTERAVVYGQQADKSGAER